MFDKVKKFIDESFGRKSPHFERAVYWVKKLKPDADEALLIAAYAHDIERAFKKQIDLKRFPNKKELEKHQGEGGKIIYDFLLSNGATEEFALRARDLIAHHEVGGTEDWDILKDADSISYFENNATKHVGWIKEKGFTKEELRRKFDWMFERISFNEAKKIAKPMYQKAMRLLEQS